MDHDEVNDIHQSFYNKYWPSSITMMLNRIIDVNTYVTDKLFHVIPGAYIFTDTNDGAGWSAPNYRTHCYCLELTTSYSYSDFIFLVIG